MTCLDQLQIDERKLLVSALNARQAFFWIGSGFSRNFGYTSWDGVLQGLSKQYGYAGPPLPNPLQFAELLCAAAIRMGSTENQFNQSVCNILQETREHYKKPEWVDEFARMASDIIVTTNWDRVLEEDIFDGYANVVARKSTNLQLDKSTRNILKIHGDISDPASLVFTHSQYNAFQRDDSYLSRKVYTLFSEMTPIFVGYSLSDPNIFYLFDEALVDTNTSNRGFMVVPSDTNDQRLDQYKLLLENKRISIIKADVPQFLQDVQNALEEVKGTVDDFRQRYARVVDRVGDIIASVSKGGRNWSVLGKVFNTHETGCAALNALSEILLNPNIYESFGGALSPIGKRVPTHATHAISQTGIQIQKNTQVSLNEADRFNSAVISLAIKKLSERDFYASDEPLTDLMSIHLENVHALFNRKIEMLIEVFNWSGPRFEYGYCWATWSVISMYKTWLSENELEAIVATIEKKVAAFAIGENTKRWLRMLKPHMSQELQIRCDVLVI